MERLEPSAGAPDGLLGTQAETHDLVIYSWVIREELVSQEIKQSVAGIGVAQCQTWDLNSIL